MLWLYVFFTRCLLSYFIVSRSIVGANFSCTLSSVRSCSMRFGATHGTDLPSACGWVSSRGGEGGCVSVKLNKFAFGWLSNRQQSFAVDSDESDSTSVPLETAIVNRPSSNRHRKLFLKEIPASGSSICLPSSTRFRFSVAKFITILCDVWHVRLVMQFIHAFLRLPASNEYAPNHRRAYVLRWMSARIHNRPRSFGGPVAAFAHARCTIRPE